MINKYVQKGIIAGPVSSAVILFSLFFIALAGLLAGYKVSSSLIIYFSVMILIVLTIFVKQLNNRSYISLSLLDNGLEYKSYFWKYFRFIEITMNISWDEIEEISWLNREGGIFKVKTQKGSFNFFSAEKSNNIAAFETIKEHVEKREINI